MHVGHDLLTLGESFQNTSTQFKSGDLCKPVHQRLYSCKKTFALIKHWPQRWQGTEFRFIIACTLYIGPCITCQHISSPILLHFIMLDRRHQIVLPRPLISCHLVSYGFPCSKHSSFFISPTPCLWCTVQHLCSFSKWSISLMFASVRYSIFWSWLEAFSCFLSRQHWTPLYEILSFMEIFFLIFFHFAKQ